MIKFRSFLLLGRRCVAMAGDRSHLLAGYISRSYTLLKTATHSSILTVLCCVHVKKMERMTSVLLLLVTLGIFIQSSQALECYLCYQCDSSSTLTRDCGDVCVKVYYEDHSELIYCWNDCEQGCPTGRIALWDKFS